MSDIVELLRNEMKHSDELCYKAADEIERLREKCNKLVMILRRLSPDNYPDTYFIHGELGEKDQNGMPEKIMVVPAYGVDFSYIYTREEKTVGPEW